MQEPKRQDVPLFGQWMNQRPGVPFDTTFWYSSGHLRPFASVKDMSATLPSLKRPIRVLSASADPALRRSRELLLRTQGCEVRTSLSKFHAKELIQAEAFDLLVFGNSLTPKTCRELAKDFRLRNSQGKIIEILSARWNSPMNQPDATAVGPEELISAIHAFFGGEGPS